VLSLYPNSWRYRPSLTPCASSMPMWMRRLRNGPEMARIICVRERERRARRGEMRRFAGWKEVGEGRVSSLGSRQKRTRCLR